MAVSSFLEKVILLILTGILSGFLIPFILKQIETNKIRKQVIIQSQEKLLEDFSKTLMTIETLFLDISYYKQESDEALYKKAFDTYNSRIVDLLSQWRVSAIKAKYLVSDDIFKKMEDFQILMFRVQDSPLSTLSKNDDNRQQWFDLHKKNIEMLEKAMSLINEIAVEMKITKKDLK